MQKSKQTSSSNNTREGSTQGYYQMVNNENRLIIFFTEKDGDSLYSQQKNRPGADCGSDHELLIEKFRLKLKKLVETTKPFSESPSVMSDSLWPHGLQPVRLLCPWTSSCQNTVVGSFHSPADLPNPGIEPRSPTLQVDSLPAELTGKLKNTAVGSLSLLQGIFPTQELYQDLLHYRQILYRLSHRGDSLLEPERGKQIDTSTK